MNARPRILVADDEADNLLLLQDRLERDYDLLTASDGEQALALATQHHPDLILLDVQMPKLDGFQVCRMLKADASMPFTPIILVTGQKVSTPDMVAGLELGADEYVTKPVDSDALLARVRSMLRTKALWDELQALNRTLDARVQEQVAEMERLGRLRRFVSPEIAQRIVSSGDEQLLIGHRRQHISVVCCQLRGFTEFAVAASPEDVIDIVLPEFHREMGLIIDRYQGTVERLTADNLTVIFNDPLPCANHEEQAVLMAVEMRERVSSLAQTWWERLGNPRKLGLGVGIDSDNATVGLIGSESRSVYAAIGPVADRAARLGAAAQDGQILVNQRVLTPAVLERFDSRFVGQMEFEGLRDPLRVRDIVGPARHVFLSYSSQHTALTERVCQILESNRIRCWMAPRDIKEGEEWSGAIVRAVESSSLVLLLLTAGAAASPQVLNEASTATSKGGRILTLCIAGVRPSDALRFHIGTSHWLTTPDPPDEADMQKLVQVVKDLLAPPGGAPSPPCGMSGSQTAGSG